MALCLHRAVVVQAVEEAGAEVGGQLVGDAAAIADLGEVEQLEPALEHGLRERRVLVRRRVRRRAGGGGLEVLEIEVGEERASRRAVEQPRHVVTRHDASQCERAQLGQPSGAEHIGHTENQAAGVVSARQVFEREQLQVLQGRPVAEQSPRCVVQLDPVLQ